MVAVFIKVLQINRTDRLHIHKEVPNKEKAHMTVEAGKS
jgi:hypothetical protein